MKIEEFYQKFWSYYADPNQRVGQALMNALACVPGRLWNETVEAGLDCFYNDDLWPETLAFIVENWKD